MVGGGIRQTMLHSSSSASSSLPFFDATTPENKHSSLLMGCVCYDPSIGDIWGGIKEYLVHEAKVPFDYVLFSNYQTQVKSLLNGHIDIAWNGPIAHVMTEQACPPEKQVVSLGMRDVDQDFESIVVVRKDAKIATLNDLNGRVVVTGASDSPQAHVVPLYYLEMEAGIQFQSVIAQEYDVGKHGDTAVGEVKALEALVSGKGPKAEAAILSRMMWERALAGTLPSVDDTLLSSSCEELNTVTLPKFDHCQFDALLPCAHADNDKEAKLCDFGQALFAMEWDNPEHQRLLKLEGIKREWVPPRQPGYDIVRSALMTRAGGKPIQAASNFQYAGKSRSFSTAATSTSSSPRVAVIGAGIAGVQTLRSLKAAGINATAFEASGKVGGLWKSNYSNFGVQVVRPLYEFPDYPMTEIKSSDYATGPQVQSYTENYVDNFGLRPNIQFHTQVQSVKQEQSDKDKLSWKIETKNSQDGNIKTDTYDYVVVATGLFSNSNKFLPSSLKDKENVVHSSDFCDAGVANGKRVVVVGGGKSAVDCAIEASKAGASSVTLLQREPHWPTPRNIAGLIPFQYVFLSRFGQGLVSTYTGPLPETGFAVNASHKVFGSWVTRPILRLVEEIFALQFNLKGELRPKQGVVEDLYDVALILNSDLTEMRSQGKVDVKIGEIESANGDSLNLKDGSTLDEVDLVVAATGFQQDFSFFDEKTLDDIGRDQDGLYLYRGIVPEKVPNLAFVGHVACVSNITAYGLQAEWLARLLTGRVEAKSSESMHAEIQAKKKWARSWIPPTKSRGMTLMLHQTHYYDQLLKDMGENPHRKMPNILAEMFMPYTPADYHSIIGGGGGTTVTNSTDTKVETERA